MHVRTVRACRRAHIVQAVAYTHALANAPKVSRKTQPEYKLLKQDCSTQAGKESLERDTSGAMASAHALIPSALPAHAACSLARSLASSLKFSAPCHIFLLPPCFPPPSSRFLRARPCLFRLVLTHSLAYSLTHSFISSLTPSLTLSLANSFTHSLTHSLTYLLTHSLTHSLARSLARSLAHTQTHASSRFLSLPETPGGRRLLLQHVRQRLAARDRHCLVALAPADDAAAHHGARARALTRTPSPLREGACARAG
eukprot:3991455-Pleurochrysis_carterae.AAC.2